MIADCLGFVPGLMLYFGIIIVVVMVGVGLRDEIRRGR